MALPPAQHPILRSKRLTLREPALRHIDEIYAIAKDPAVARYTLLPQPYRRKDAAGFVKKAQKKPKDKTRYQLAIFENETGKLIGMIGLHHIHPTSKNAEIGYWIGVPYWGKGIATEAVGLMLAFGFGKLGLERIYAKVFHKNPPSAHVLEKQGFLREGTMRHSMLRNKEWYDEHIYGLLKREHRARLSRRPHL